MNQRVARQAKPFEAVENSGRPLPIDDEADASWRQPLRRMADMRRQQDDLAGSDRDVAGAFVLADSQHDVAGKLVEEFLEGIVVVIGPQIGSADHRDDEIGIAPDLRMAARRLKQSPMLFNPFVERERQRIKRRHWCLPELSLFSASSAW